MKKCKKCNKDFKPIKGLLNYCSLSCRNSKGPRSQETKNKISNSLKGREGRKGYKYPPITQETKNKISKGIKKYLKENPGIREGKGHKMSEETKEKQSLIKKEFYKKYPEKHPNRRCAGIKESYPEKMVREYFEQNKLINGIDFIPQYSVGKYYVDFYIPKLNLCLEVDGERWHDFKSEREINRSKFIKTKFNLIRFKAKEIITKSKQSLLKEIINASMV